MSPIAKEKTSVSPAALSAVLDAVEVVPPATLKSISEATGLGLSTVTRAADLCMVRRILRYRNASDPVTGRACRVLVPAEGVLLPVLTLSGGFGSVAVTDMSLTPLYRSAAEFSPSSPPEEQARLLCGRCLTLLRGCGGDRQVAAPILVTGEGMETASVRRAVTDSMGASPLVLTERGEAVSRGIKGSTVSQAADSLLFLSVGEGSYATLLLRDGDGSWSPSSLGRGLTATLVRSLREAAPSAEGVRRGIAVYLTELCRFLSPRRIVIEAPNGVLPDGELLSSLLPEGAEVCAVPSPNGLTVAERGAATEGRRRLWNEIMGI